MAKIDLYGEDLDAKCTQQVLWQVLEQTLKLLHPFMPFITEEIWQHIPHDGKSIMTSNWPEYKPEWNFENAYQMELVMDAVRGIRNIRADMNVLPSKKAKAFVRASDSEVMNVLQNNMEIIYSLAKVSEMSFGKEDSPIPQKAVSCVIKGAEIFVPMEGLVDFDTEIERLKKEKENLKKEIEEQTKKLSNQGFLQKAPQDVVDKERHKQKDYQEMLQKVKQRLQMMTELI